MDPSRQVSWKTPGWAPATMTVAIAGDVALRSVSLRSRAATSGCSDHRTTVPSTPRGGAPEMAQVPPAPSPADATRTSGTEPVRWTAPGRWVRLAALPAARVIATGSSPCLLYTSDAADE